jgi:hypothetical protein
MDSLTSRLTWHRLSVLEDGRHSVCFTRSEPSLGSDGHRFGGGRICNGLQIRAEFLEGAVLREVFDLQRNPEKPERECQKLSKEGATVRNVRTPKALCLKRQHAPKSQIDRFAEGLIETDRFTSRMAQAKGGIAEQFGNIVPGAYTPLLAKDSKMDGPEVRFWDDCR